MPLLYDVMREYEHRPDFTEVHRRITACSLSAQGVIGLLKLEFEWKSGWLTESWMSRYRQSVQTYRRHFQAMTEAPPVVENIAWDLLHTGYWQAYFHAYKRALPDRGTFHERYFVTLPVKALSLPVKSTRALARIEKPLITPRVPRPIVPVVQKTIRSWKALRFQILKRDAYRCRLCGVSAADGIEVRLEVDHITPRSKGGTDDMINLWTLCFACNRGKGTQEL